MLGVPIGWLEDLCSFNVLQESYLLLSQPLSTHDSVSWMGQERACLAASHTDGEAWYPLTLSHGRNHGLKRFLMALSCAPQGRSDVDKLMLFCFQFLQCIQTGILLLQCCARSSLLETLTSIKPHPCVIVYIAFFGAPGPRPGGAGARSWATSVATAKPGSLYACYPLHGE